MPDNTETVAAPASEQVKRDFRQEVTDQIITMLEKGTAPWQKLGTFHMLFNPATEKGYRGNALHLMAVAAQKRYEDPRWLTYTNVLLAMGTDSAILVQRNPVPIAMWRPIGPGGTALRLAGRGTLDIAGQRAPGLIRYEQLLVWPVLHRALEHPTLVLGIANDYWCRGTRIPAAQQACLKAWVCLFNLPMLSATNYGDERWSSNASDARRNRRRTVMALTRRGRH